MPPNDTSYTSPNSDLASGRRTLWFSASFWRYTGKLPQSSRETLPPQRKRTWCAVMFTGSSRPWTCVELHGPSHGSPRQRRSWSMHIAANEGELAEDNKLLGAARINRYSSTLALYRRDCSIPFQPSPPAEWSINSINKKPAYLLLIFILRTCNKSVVGTILVKAGFKFNHLLTSCKSAELASR